MAKMTVQEKKWRADADCSTLIEAEKIKKDKPRLKAAMAYAKEKREAIDSVMEKKET